MTDADKRDLARSGIHRWLESVTSGQEWMREQFQARLSQGSSRCGAKQFVYGNKPHHLKAKMREIEPRLAENAAFEACAFKTNDPHEFQHDMRDQRATQRDLYHNGRFILDCALFFDRIDKMARRLVLEIELSLAWKNPVQEHIAMACLIP